MRQSVPKQPRQPRATAIAILLLTLGSGFFLFAFRASTMTGDSLNYAYSIREGSELFHPHHLLFNPIARGFYVALSRFWRGCDVILAAQIHNIFWAAVAMLAVFAVIRRLTGSAAWGAAASVSLLVTKGFWAYSTQVEVYVPALACLALVTALLVVDEKFAGTVLGAGCISLLFSLSILYHQSSVFFSAALVFFLASNKNRRTRKNLPWILAISGVVVLAAYVKAFLLTAGPKTLGTFVHFCLSYAFHPTPDWATLKNLSLTGAGHLILSQARIVVAFSSRQYLPAALIAAVGLGALSTWHIFRIRKKGDRGELRLSLLLWLLASYLFLVWNAPGAYELLIVALFPIEILIILAARDAWPALKTPVRCAVVGIWAACVLAIGLVNFIGVVRPAHMSKGPDYDEAKILNLWAPAESVILTDWSVQQHLRFYFQRESSLEVDIPFYCFLRRLPLPPEYRNVHRAGLVISPFFLYPETELSRVVRLNGYLYPSEWQKWLGWILGFEYDSLGRLASCRSFEANSLGSGYLSVSASRIEVDGLGDILKKLDAQIQTRLHDPVPHFLNWFKNYRAVRLE